MQKKIVALAVTVVCATAMPVMAQASGASKVEMWGIVDAAVRHTNNEGPNKGSLTKMMGGGMSQSRWGLKVEEDLGGGSKALVELEHRFNADTGEKDTTAPFFQLAYVGLQGSYGRLTAGRQWNVLFDVVTSTYASFPYSPYMEAYKPELGMALGARTSNMLKYTFATPSRNFVGSLQYSFDENNTIDDVGLAGVSTTGAVRTVGGYLRYAQNGFAFGGGYLGMKLPGGSKVDAWTLGGSYRTGPWYFSAGYGLNKRKGSYDLSTLSGMQKAAIDNGMLSAYWSGQTNGGFTPGSPADNANKRQLFKVGLGYQATPQLNVGLHYFRGKQSGSITGNFNSTANFVVAVADFAFSKRTDAYLGVDHTSISGGQGTVLDGSGGGARSRTGFTVGLRHRF